MRVRKTVAMRRRKGSWARVSWTRPKSFSDNGGTDSAETVFRAGRLDVFGPDVETGLPPAPLLLAVKKGDAAPFCLDFAGETAFLDCKTWDPLVSDGRELDFAARGSSLPRHRDDFFAGRLLPSEFGPFGPSSFRFSEDDLVHSMSMPAAGTKPEAETRFVCYPQRSVSHRDISEGDF